MNDIFEPGYGPVQGAVPEPFIIMVLQTAALCRMTLPEPEKWID